MRLQVKGKNVEVTPSIREYAERKLAKLAKQLAEPRRRSRSSSPSSGTRRSPTAHVAEATIFTKGPTLRAREASPDMKASIDQLVDKLERQVKRYREKRRVEPRRHAPQLDDIAVAEWACSGATSRCTSSWPRRAGSTLDAGRAPATGAEPARAPRRRPGWDGEPPADGGRASTACRAPRALGRRRRRPRRRA